MQRSITTLLVLLLLYIHLLAQNTQQSVYFPTAKHLLTSEAQTNLDAVIPQLLNQHDFVIEVQAHTDDRGSTDYNQALAERRATSVKDYLAARGVEVEKVSTTSFGEENPAHTNENAQGRQLNRRVDVLMTPYGPKDVDDLLGRMRRSHQNESFTVDATKDIKLVSPSGTSIYIDQESFVDENGNTVKGKVQIELKEAYNKLDMILSGVTTMSGQRLLETGGMLKIEATANGEPVQLKKGKSVAIGIPVEEERKKGMQLFNGIHNEEEEEVFWEPTRQAAARSAGGLVYNNKKPKAPVHNFWFAKYEKPAFEESIKPGEIRNLREPNEPNKSKIKLKLKFFQKIFMSKAKKDAERQKIYEKRLKSYEKRFARYNKFLEAKELYERDTAAYTRAVAAWKQRYIDHRLNYVDSYKTAKARYDQRHEELQLQYKEDLASWKKEVEAFEAKYEQQGNMDQAGLASYFFSVNGMGWINCDRFLFIPPDKKRQLAVEDPVRGDEQVYAIFTRTNSIIRLEKQRENYFMNGLPDGMPVKLVGIRVEEGQPMLAVKEIKIGSRTPHELEFEASSLPDIRATLTAL